MAADPIRAAREELAEMVRRARPSIFEVLTSPASEPPRQTARGDGYSRNVAGTVLHPERWRDAPAREAAPFLVALPPPGLAP